MKYTINEKGEKIYYQELGERLYGNYFIFVLNGKTGIQNCRFEIIVSPLFDAINPAFGQHFWGKTSQKWALYNFENARISNMYLRCVNPFHLQFACVSSDGKNFGFINRSGILVIPEKYCGGVFLGLDYFAVSVMLDGEKKFGVIDFSENIMHPFTLKSKPTFSETVVYLLKKRKPLREWLGI